VSSRKQKTGDKVSHPSAKISADLLEGARAKEREDRLAALADGRRQRSLIFRPRKGRGSYRRKGKDSASPQITPE
jgi:stalled ribosome alternative rescue factor ArfA